jgi:2-C-methyl-D-erythritol 2,4-cyclodiphosphate synthase
MDAMLGALALGDIGKWFPNTDKKWEMANSVNLLRIVNEAVLEHGYTVGNVDITIILQSPRLADYIEQMRMVLAKALKTEIGNVSIKATTEEGMGFTGDGTGVSATAVVLLSNTPGVPFCEA